jgi:hypothetical protein
MKIFDHILTITECVGENTEYCIYKGTLNKAINTVPVGTLVYANFSLDNSVLELYDGFEGTVLLTSTIFRVEVM